MQRANQSDSDDEEASISEHDKNNDKNDAVDVMLSNFRQLWQKEIKSEGNQPYTSSVNSEVNPTYTSSVNTKKNLNSHCDINSNDNPVVENEEEQAKELFLLGIKHEKKGNMYEAIKFYNKSVHMIPDIEHRIYESAKLQNKGRDNKTLDYPASTTNLDKNNVTPIESTLDDLLENIQSLGFKNGRICSWEIEKRETHISSLPREIMLYILRWVVSNDLDMISLERFASVCSGFYFLARDSEIWKIACIKTWGVHCSTFNTCGYSSWRQMFVERVRLQFNGYYLSKTTYVRPGENSFQDQHYKPWHLIRYFRYLRFFPEGVVLMMTTPDDPKVCLDRLRHRHGRVQGVLSGHYRLRGDRVTIMVDRITTSQNKIVQSARNKSRRKENIKDTFHLELIIKSHNSPTHCSLIWRKYAIFGHNVSDGSVTSTHFEITKNKFPPFRFFQSNGFHSHSESPLE